MAEDEKTLDTASEPEKLDADITPPGVDEKEPTADGAQDAAEQSAAPEAATDDKAAVSDAQEPVAEEKPDEAAEDLADIDDDAETVSESKSIEPEPEPKPEPKRDRSKKYKEPTNGGGDKEKGATGKKKKEPGKVRRWFKDFFSELKKVTWPSFGKVLKQTGIVLAVTVCFLLVLMAFDSLFGYLYRLLVGGLGTESVTALMSTLLGGGGLL